MPRVLTTQHVTITAADRPRHMDRLRLRRAHYEAARCRYWVFEDTAFPGAFVEFTEADDRATLSAAHASAPESTPDSARIYQQVEIS